LNERLDQLINLNKLQGYLSLNQLVSQPSEQRQVREALNKLPLFWQPLLDVGVPVAALQAELTKLQALPTEDIDSALAGPLAEPYRPLWLGPTEDGVAAMVTLHCCKLRRWTCRACNWWIVSVS
jgi:predicted exporter